MMHSTTSLHKVTKNIKIKEAIRQCRFIIQMSLANLVSVSSCHFKMPTTILHSLCQLECAFIFYFFQWCIDLAHFMEFSDVIKAPLYAAISKWSDKQIAN